MSDYYGMTFERYDFLMDEEGPCVHLNEREIKDGWHFCDDWDGLLIHPDSDEFRHCCCSHMKEYKTPERAAAYQQRRDNSHKALDKLAELDQELGLT